MVSFKTNDLSYFFRSVAPLSGCHLFGLSQLTIYKPTANGLLTAYQQRDEHHILCGSGFFISTCFDFPVITEFIHGTDSEELILFLGAAY